MECGEFLSFFFLLISSLYFLKFALVVLRSEEGASDCSGHHPALLCCRWWCWWRTWYVRRPICTNWKGIRWRHMKDYKGIWKRNMNAYQKEKSKAGYFCFGWQHVPSAGGIVFPLSVNIPKSGKTLKLQIFYHFCASFFSVKKLLILKQIPCSHGMRCFVCVFFFKTKNSFWTKLGNKNSYET